MLIFHLELKVYIIVCNFTQMVDVCRPSKWSIIGNISTELCNSARTHHTDFQFSPIDSRSLVSLKTNIHLYDIIRSPMSLCYYCYYNTGVLTVLYFKKSADLVKVVCSLRYVLKMLCY